VDKEVKVPQIILQDMKVTEVRKVTKDLRVIKVTNQQDLKVIKAPQVVVKDPKV